MIESETISLAADPVVQYLGKPELEKLLATTKSRMMKAAKDLDFMEAARLRDEMMELEKMVGRKVS